MGMTGRSWGTGWREATLPRLQWVPGEIVTAAGRKEETEQAARCLYGSIKTNTQVCARPHDQHKAWTGREEVCLTGSRDRWWATLTSLAASTSASHPSHQELGRRWPPSCSWAFTAALRTTSCQTEDSQTELLNLSNHTTGCNWPEQHDGPLDPLKSPQARKTSADLRSTKRCQKCKTTPRARPASFSTKRPRKTLALAGQEPSRWLPTEGPLFFPTLRMHRRLQKPVRVAKWQ